MAITGCILYPQVHLGSIWGLRGHNLAPKWAKMSQNPDMAKGAVFGHFWAGTLTNYIFFTILVHNKSQQVIISQKKLGQAMNRFWWGDQNGPLYHSDPYNSAEDYDQVAMARTLLMSDLDVGVKLEKVKVENRKVKGESWKVLFGSYLL